MKQFLLIGLILFSILSTAYPKYDTKQAFKFFEYSKISYCDSKSINNWTCESCGTKPGITHKDVYVVEGYTMQSQSYIAYDANENLIIVAIRGTSNAKNWMSDFQTQKMDYNYCIGCQIHQGFYNVWDSMSFNVMNYVKVFKEIHKARNPKLLVTGHSLGGAVAMIATMDLHKRKQYKADYFITYGQPRVGNEQFVKYFDMVFPQAQRVVHMRDPVPRVPLTAMGYRHGHQEIWYNSKNDYSQYRECSMVEGEDRSCSDSIVSNDVMDHLKYYGIYTGCGLKTKEKIANDKKQFGIFNIFPKK